MASHGIRLKRGGQVYLLHNEVETIANMREKLVPEARIVTGHGQINERELERVMRDFTGQRTNLLLCTTIIETGIDNPHANTILINRAVAQLRQGKEVAAVDLMQPPGISTEINLRTPAPLPDAYCPDVHERLTLYKSLANCEAGGTDRPLRPVTAASAVAARHASPAAAGQAAMSAKAGRHRRPSNAAVRPEIFPQSARRPGEDHRADPEKPELQAGRAG